jgi:hypothetical protein
MYISESRVRDIVEELMTPIIAKAKEQDKQLKLVDHKIGTINDRLSEHDKSLDKL